MMHADTMLRSVIKGASTAFLARVLFTIASFAITSLTARAYGASTVGIVASLTTVMTLGGIVANLGTSSSVNFHIATQLHAASVLSARRSYHRIVGICLCGSLLGGLVLLWFPALIDKILDGGIQGAAPMVLLGVAVIGIPLRLFSELTGLALRAFENIPGFAVLIVLPALLNLALLGSGVVMGAGPMAAVWALLGGLGASAMAGFVWVELHLRAMSDGKPETQSPSTHHILRHAFPMLFSTIGAYVVTSIGLLITPILADHTATGQLAIALRLATTTSFVLMSINAITTPMFARLHAAGDEAGLIRLARRTSRMMFWAVLPLIMGLIVFGRPVITLAFGPQFAPAYVPMVIMLLGQLVNTVTGPSEFLMNMAQMQKPLRNIILPSAVVAIITSLLLIPTLGITGAAIAYAISLTGWNLASAYYLRRRFGVWIAYIPGFADPH
jgi:O-antigen/teichoic acid export membrane protein